MTDLARKALLATLPALALALALPAAAGQAPAGMPAGDAAPAATSDAALSGPAPGATPAKPPRHRRHRHAARKGGDADAAEQGEARSQAGGPDPSGREGETEAGRRPGAARAAATGSGPTVLGDSIGIGLSMASGAPRLAHEGVAIRSSAALAQLQRVPERSTVVLSLGTNDAVGSIRGVEGAVDRIVALAERNELHVVWLGPPCVFKSWNGTAERLDALLRQRLGNDGRVRYVSAADPAVCDRSLRAGDGVHFTMKGYAMLWRRVVAAEGDWAARPARQAAEAASRTASNDR